MSVIVNNTVLSNFAFVDRLELLKDIFQRIYITPSVFQEVVNGIKGGYHFQKRTLRLVDNQEWMILTDLKQQELPLFHELLSKLGKGETSCIAVAKKRDWLFLTDDMTARKIASNIDVMVTGTIGILKISVEQNLIPIQEGNSILLMMIENGYFSPVRNLSDLA